jgi:hypothetical protein
LSKCDFRRFERVRGCSWPPLSEQLRAL